jgi:heptosyltransferase-2
MEHERLQRAARKIDPAGIRSILVRATNWLGDAVMTTPALGALRVGFPAARITLLATPLVAELFSPHEWLDEVLVFERSGRHRGARGRLRLAAELRRRRFDLAVLFPNSFDAALVAWLARIPQRLGYATDGRRLLLTHPVPVSCQEPDVHQSGNYLALLAQAGIAAGPCPQRLTVIQAESAGIASRLQAAGIGPTDCVIGINPGATYGSAKRWYPERFAAVADELAARWGAHVVLTGGPDEAAIAADIARQLSRPCLNLAGQTRVRELMALIKRCDFFITNDSGPMHIAAALEVPLVAVFGPTDHATTYPLGSRTVLVRGEADCAPCLLRECPTDHCCMTSVTPAMVIAAAQRLKDQLDVRSSMPSASNPEPGSSNRS